MFSKSIQMHVVSKVVDLLLLMVLYQITYWYMYYYIIYMLIAIERKSEGQSVEIAAKHSISFSNLAFLNRRSPCTVYVCIHGMIFY